MKKADASGAEFVVFATEDEMAEGCVAVKALRDHAGENVAFAQQQKVPVAEAAAAIAAAMKALG